MVAMDPAHGLAHLVVGGRGDRAGVEYDESSIVRAGRARKTLRREAGFYGGSVSLRCPASEVFLPKIDPLYLW